MHLSTTKPAAFRMLEPFGEVGGDVPEYFSSEHILLKLKIKKLLRKISSKKLNSWSSVTNCLLSLPLSLYLLNT